MHVPRENRWHVLIDRGSGAYGIPAGGPYKFLNYTDCVRAIQRLERGEPAILGNVSSW